MSSLFSPRMVGGELALRRSTSGLKRGEIAPPVPVFMMMPLDTVEEDGKLSSEAVGCLPVRTVPSFHSTYYAFLVICVGFCCVHAKRFADWAHACVMD
jgi:hypothetical protein